MCFMLHNQQPKYIGCQTIYKIIKVDSRVEENSPLGTKDKLSCDSNCVLSDEKGNKTCAYSYPLAGVGQCYCNCVEKDTCSGLKKIEECDYGCA